MSEVDGTTTSTLSPDGSLRVESDCIQDDRSGLWDSVRVLDLRDGDVLASLHSYGMAAQLAFPAERQLSLRFGDRQLGDRTLIIDAVSKRYRFAEDAEFVPLSGLPAALHYGPARPYEAVLSDGPLHRLGRWLGGVGGLVLAGGGLWQLTCGASLKDRALGGLCLLLFGWSSLEWLRKRG